MRAILYIAVLAIPFALATQASAKSCSAAGTIKSYDEAGATVEIEFEKGNKNKFFVRPEGATGDISKVPKDCRRSLLKNTTLPVKATGGRMSITQVRNNITGKMQNDTESAEWFANQMSALISEGSEVWLVLRPGKSKKDPAQLTTIYLPATAEDMKEIARMESQVSDVE